MPEIEKPVPVIRPIKADSEQQSFYIALTNYLNALFDQHELKASQVIGIISQIVGQLIEKFPEAEREILRKVAFANITASLFRHKPSTVTQEKTNAVSDSPKDA